MVKDRIPSEWELEATPRYIRQDMDKAMGGKLERGLVELITNSDDSFRDLEEKGKQVSGKIRIEILRRKKGQPSTVIVRDRAGGMNREEMYIKLGKLGGRTSGVEKGKARRGLHGRGARDVVAFGTVHYKSIKDDEYNHLIITPDLKCRFTEATAKRATSEVRQELGIRQGNGTVVEIEVAPSVKVPQHETLSKDFSRYYSLRDLFSNPGREVMLVDLGKKRETRLQYKAPIGEVVYDSVFTIPNYPEAKARLVIYKHSTPFEQDHSSPYREGILIKSAAAIHSCTYFGLESEPFSWRFTGALSCEFMDKLIREYDDRDEANRSNPGHPDDNPMRLLDPSRDGLLLGHPFAQAIYKKCKEILRALIEEIKASEVPQKRDVSNENLSSKLGNLSKEISKVYEKKAKEFEGEIPPGPIPGPTEGLPIGLHIIPPGEQPVVVNQPKTFSIIVKHYEALEEALPIDVSSSDDDVKVRTSPVSFKDISEDGKVGRTTFTVGGSKVGAEALIEARCGDHTNVLLVKVIEQPPPPPAPPVPNGLTFEEPLYHLRVNKEKPLVLRLKNTSKLGSPIIAEIASDHPEVVVKGGGRCQLRETDIPGVVAGNCRILGRQLKAKGTITARVKGNEPAYTRVVVDDRPQSRIEWKFEPEDVDFSPVRYRVDDKIPYRLIIGAKHPSIRKYLGIPTEGKYPGIDSLLYHAVLAEVIAEAFAFDLLERQFKRDGQEGMLDYTSTDSYYHKHFSEFLRISHEILIPENPAV